MEEGKSSSELFSMSDVDGDGLEQLSVANLSLAKRLGSAMHGLELPDAIPDDDEAVASVMGRFRRPGLFGGSLAKVASLDSQALAAPEPSREFEGFVLDALEPAESHQDHYILEEVSLQGSSSRSGKLPAGQIACPHCGASNPQGMRFCVQCGGGLEGAQTSPPARIAQAARQPPPPSEASKQANPWEIHLISINEDGSDGVGIPLEFLETTVGRDGDTRFPTDAFLSPKHARLHIERGELFIEDLYSLNGTFLKLREEAKLTPGDTFLMGRQVLRFERFEQSISPKTKSSDGTRYMGSPAPGGNFKILQIGIGGIVQNVYCLPDSGAVLGREKGDIVFPHDKFMSSRHAQIYTGDDGSCYLIDLTSSNGTWIKLWERTKLRHNDYIFMGQQLFRIHIRA